jgi:hypothetical protein
MSRRPGPTMFAALSLRRLMARRALPTPWTLAALVILPPALSAQDPMDTRSSFPDLSRSSNIPAERVPIFFPPTPPPLGRALPRNVPPTGRLVAPPELAVHVNEPFYPPLATRLALRRLSDKQRQQVEKHRSTKVALQGELQAELERTQALEPGAREQALAAFALRQAPALAALEASAEQLRRDLLASEYSWGAQRQWRLSDKEKRGFSPLEIAQVMRAAAYYENGLLPAQRRLLREIALELQSAGDSAESATANQPFLFFPPEPARVQLPDAIPAEVAAKLAEYETRKSALKKELYDAVFANDGKSFAFLRGNPLKTLAGRQSTALAELETLAEEIRRGLAVMPEAAPIVERTPLPPLLQNRMTVLLREVGTAQRETVERVEALIAEGRELPMQVTYRFEADGLKYLVIPSRVSRGPSALTPEVQARILALREKIAAVANDYGRRLTEFLAERDAIRDESAKILGLTQPERIDAAISTAVRVALARETEGVYREYRVALFEPGLSPEQRRLLFDRVVEHLELPLPRGEMQPTFRASTW